MRLTPEVRGWVASAWGPGTEVIRARRLVGGIASVVHAVTVRDRTGRTDIVVLRRYPPGVIVRRADA